MLAFFIEMNKICKIFSFSKGFLIFALIDEKNKTEEDKEIERKEKAKQRRSRTNFRFGKHFGVKYKCKRYF